MNELFLIASSNGNGESFLLVLSDGKNCVKQFKARTVEVMAQHLGEEHLADIQENLINSEELPCTACAKAKKCLEKHNFINIAPDIIREILNLVLEEQGENISEYLERDE